MKKYLIIIPGLVWTLLFALLLLTVRFYRIEDVDIRYIKIFLATIPFPSVMWMWLIYRSWFAKADFSIAGLRDHYRIHFSDKGVPRKILFFYMLAVYIMFLGGIIFINIGFYVNFVFAK